MKKYLIILLIMITQIGFSQVQNAKFKALGITKILYFDKTGAIDTLIIENPDTTGQFLYRNVANGVLPTDAINKRQLEAWAAGYDSVEFDITDGYWNGYSGGVVKDSTLLDGRYRLLSDTITTGISGKVAVTNTDMSISYSYMFDSTDYRLFIQCYYDSISGSDTSRYTNGYDNIRLREGGFTITGINEVRGFIEFFAVDTVMLNLAPCLAEEDPFYGADSSFIKTGIRFVNSDSSNVLHYMDTLHTTGAGIASRYDVSLKQNILTNPVTTPNNGVSGYIPAYSGNTTIDSCAWRINGRNLGYGISPTSIFQIEGLGQTNTLMTISNDKNAAKDSIVTILPSGYVGIGTNAPTSKLYVNGEIFSTSGIGVTSGQFFYCGSVNYGNNGLNKSTSNKATYSFGTVTASGAYPLSLSSGSSSTYLDGYISLLTTGVERIRINYDGNTGIGTSTPQSKLSVHGTTVAAQGIFNATNSYFNKITSTLAQATDTCSVNIKTSTTGEITLNIKDKAGATQFQNDSLTTTANGKTVNLYSSDYGEMYMYDNVTACVIDNTDVYHAVYNSFGNNDGTLAPNLDATCFTYKAGAAYAIASVVTYNGGTQIQCTVTAGHSLLAGEPITITNSTNYNGTYLVEAAGLTATEFVVTKAYVATNTGSARKPATLKVLKSGIYHAEFNGGGVTVSANDVIKMELNRGITPLNNIARKVEWTTNNRPIGAGGLVSCTANDYIWLSVKNTSGTGDLTITTMNVNMFRK